MDSDPTYWLPDSPWSAPARRWLRASWLYERGKRIKRGFDDEGVRRALHFMRAGGSAEAKPASAKAKRTDLALADALLLYHAEPAVRRWLLEAWLLTEEPIEVVARRCSVPAATALTFHDIFFDVRPHRQAHDWIWLRAVRAGAWNNYSREYPGGIWKGLAYTCGPLALEQAIAVTSDGPFPDWARDWFQSDAIYEEARLRLLGKLLVAALTTNSHTEMGALIRVREQLCGLDGQVLDAPCMASGMLFAKTSTSHTAGKGAGSENQLAIRRDSGTRPPISATGKRPGRETADSLLEAPKEIQGRKDEWHGKQEAYETRQA